MRVRQIGLSTYRRKLLNDVRNAMLCHITPGHNPGCITWAIGDAVFTGDAYIPGIKTVTNLPGADKALAAQSELSILKLAEGKQIFPGHKI